MPPRLKKQWCIAVHCHLCLGRVGYNRKANRIAACIKEIQDSTDSLRYLAKKQPKYAMIPEEINTSPVKLLYLAVCFLLGWCIKPLGSLSGIKQTWNGSKQTEAKKKYEWMAGPEMSRHLGRFPYSLPKERSFGADIHPSTSWNIHLACQATVLQGLQMKLAILTFHHLELQVSTENMKHEMRSFKNV